MAVDVNARVVTQNGKKVAQIDYRRPGVGLPGQVPDERVRQYSFPINGNLYRITCFAIASAFPKYETAFQWVAGSLIPGELLSR